MDTKNIQALLTEADGFYSAHSDVMNLVCGLAAALKASEERARKAEKTQEQLYDEWREELRVSERERDAIAAANLAANKRIVELEHERDAALLAAQGARRTAFNAEQKAKALDAVQRDTIARLEAQVKELRLELARLTTPRPIAEAPRNSGSQIIALWMDGDVVESMDVVVWADMDDGEHPERKFWMNMAGDSVEHMTHYLPMPEVKRPCWEPKP